MDALDRVVAELRSRLGADSGLGFEVKLEFGPGLYVFIDARAVPHEILCKDEPADCCLSLSPDTFWAVASGSQAPDAALRDRGVRVTGDGECARRFLAALSRTQSPNR